MNSLSIAILVACAACVFNTAAARPAKHLRAKRSTKEAILGLPGNICPSGYTKISTQFECAKVGNLNSESLGWQGTEKDKSWPSGCYHCRNVNECTDGTWFNKHSTGKANAGARPWCLKSTSGGTTLPTMLLTPTPPPPPPLSTISGKIMFAGDSDIEYWKTGSSFPGSTNVGVGGWTCNNVLKKIDAHLKQNNPEWVVLVCGENDLWGASVDVTFQRFKKVVAKINAFGARVLYMGTKPEPDTKSLHAAYRQYDAKIRALAAASASTGVAATAAAAAAAASNRPLLTMVDVYQSFEAVGNNNDLYRYDKLHLSSKGYRLWTQWVKLALNANLDTGAVLGCVEWLSGRCVASTSGSSGGGDSGSTDGGESGSPDDPAAATDDDDDDGNDDMCKYVKMNNGKCSANVGIVNNTDACLYAARELSLPANKIFREFTNQKRPPGCYWHKNKLWFNKHSTGTPSNRKGRKVICKVCA